MSVGVAYWAGVFIGMCIGAALTLFIQWMLRYVDSVNEDIDSIDQPFGGESHWDSYHFSQGLLDRAPPKDSKVHTTLHRPD